MAAFGVTINIILNLILIPDSGAVGAAFASLITQVLTAFAQIILALYLMKIYIPFKEWGGIILFSLLAFSFVIFRHLLPDIWWISLIITFSTLLFMTILTGMISLKGVYKIIKERS